MSTTTEPATDLRIVKDPTTPKTKAIIDAVLDDPQASNPTIADRVEEDLGERPDPSWVSRVRSTHLEEVAEAEPESVDDVITRLARVEEAVDDAARADDVDRAIAAVESLAESVEVLIDEYRAIQDTVERVENMVARDIHDDVVAYVLKRELDRVEDGG